MRSVHLVDDIVVITFHHGDTLGIKALFQHALRKVCLERAEDVACAKVYPLGCFLCFFDHLLPVIGRDEISFFFPSGIRINTACVQFHALLLLRLKHRADVISRWLPTDR